IAYFPTNARSEFTSRLSPGVLGLMKLDDGGVLDSSRKFQLASPALNQPARRPTRGSGFGAAIDRFDVAVDDAHATPNKAKAASHRRGAPPSTDRSRAARPARTEFVMVGFVGVIPTA